MRTSAAFLVALLVGPGLLGLLLAMEWLERRLTRSMVVDEILLALTGAFAPDEIETAAAQRLARLLGDRD